MAHTKLSEGMAPEFLSAQWIHLLMLNFEVDPAVLTPRVPAGTVLDDFGGRCFVSMVGFQFLRTRVLGVAVPFHQDFEEVNLRFYVRRELDDEVRKGVVFIKEIVPRRAISWVANVVYNENYVTLPMSHDDTIDETNDRGRLVYEWQHESSTCQLAASLQGKSYTPKDNSEESYITEHYWGYVSQRDGSTVEYRVEHPRWDVWQATAARFECDVSALYGSEFTPYLTSPAASAFVAKGSEVIVRRGVRV